MSQEQSQNEGGISESGLFSIVEKAGLKMVEASPINKGFENEVYDVKTDKGEHVILRIRRKGGTSFAQEAWAIRQCHDAGVPVADVLYSDAVSLEKDAPTEVMVQSKIGGVPFEEIRPSLDVATRDRVLFQIGNILRSIHSVHVEGYGNRQGDGTWDFASWEDYMTKFISDREREKELILSAGVSEEELQTSVSELRRLLEDYPCPDPVLCHGDFMPPHILVSKEFKVTGIIDFGLFRGNSPFFDLAYFNLCTSDEYMKSFAKGYQERGQVEDFEIKLRLQKIGLILKQVGRLAHPYRRAAKEQELTVWVRRLRDMVA